MEDEIEERRIDPRDEFYIALPIDNLDDKFEDPNDLADFRMMSSDLEFLKNEALEYAEEHGGETFIYRCIPVLRVHVPPRSQIEMLEDPVQTAHRVVSQATRVRPAKGRGTPQAGAK